MTDEIESKAQEYIDKIDSMGGMVAAIEKGFPQQEIQETSYQYQKAVENKEEIIVGINDLVTQEEFPLQLLQIGSEVQEQQTKRLKELRNERSNRAVKKALKELERAAQSDKNLMPFLVEAVREYATLGEMCDILKSVFGTYQEVSIY